MPGIIDRTIELYRNEGIYRVILGAKNHVVVHTKSRFRMLKRSILGFLDDRQFIGPDFIYSEEYYEKRKDDPRRSDAHAIANAIADEFEPDSVIDFGCAIGIHLEGFSNRGASICGVEGSQKAIDHAVISVNNIIKHDLREPFESDTNFDLALSFEVAEHLPERYADTFVDSITDSASAIVMTAATPGQGGTHHVNEQPREYWIEKFKERGFVYDVEITNRLRDSFEVEASETIRDNLFVFERK